jgi:ATP-dependent helicase/nuclease subunit B
MYDRIAPEELYPYFALATEAISQKKVHSQFPSQWVTYFLERLQHFNWPGERTPNSQEYQQTQLWHQLLERFAQLDSILGKLSLNDALAQCQIMASRLPFQEKVNDSPIQVLGVLEGSGLQFTHCWIMGMDQQSWPPSAKPNPLLPIHLQREYRMPHSSSLRELDYAQSLTNNYRHCANTVIFSSANYQADTEQALEASLLIQDIPLAIMPHKDSNNTLYQWQNNLQQSREISHIDCAQGPTFTESHLTGGTGLLKAQAQNPFDAFIRYRVKANPYNEPVNGFSALEKGDILHQSLASIWQSLKTQEALIKLNENELNALISMHTNTAVTRAQRKRPQALSKTLCAIEKDRQSLIIKQWLENEKQRPAFTVIATEEAHTITFNNVTLDVRIDRVDQLADGRFLIIDYKTGKASSASWQGERLQEPQLPLYALSYHQKVSGISFASINIEEQEFTGLMHDESHIQHGIKATEWEKALEEWQQALTELLTEFQNGECPIEYIQGKPPEFAKDYLSINRYFEAEYLNDN